MFSTGADKPPRKKNVANNNENGRGNVMAHVPILMEDTAEVLSYIGIFPKSVFLSEDLVEKLGKSA